MRSTYYPVCCGVMNIYDFGGDEDSFRKEHSYDHVMKRLHDITNNSSIKIFTTIVNQDQVKTKKALIDFGFKCISHQKTGSRWGKDLWIEMYIKEKQTA